MANKKNFETSLKNLQEISKKMEQEEISLENSLKLYKQGIEEATFCAKYLEEIEKEVSILQKDANGLFKLSPFYDLEENL